MGHSNFEFFLNCSTPTVRSQFLPKTCIRNLNFGWQFLDKDRIPYFNLGDLWDCYDEWSAYGMGSPIFLNCSDSVVQYYTPYLSAIQIYTAKAVSDRDIKEDCYGEFETSSWGSDCDCTKLSRSSSSNSSDRMWDTEELGVNLEVQYPVQDKRGELYFEYIEVDGPFGRVPLKDKIDKLSQKYPGLKSMDSVDLSPASWMAVAWYPIYNIPACRNAKELYASFLTYHTLSSSFQDDVSEDVGGDVCSTKCGKRDTKCKGDCSTTPLPPFGLATYRMQSKIWLNPESSDHLRLSSLISAASSWLKQLQVQHHDFNYFITHPL